jgi:hypothetical protein
MNQEAGRQVNKESGRISAPIECEPCRERGRPGVEAERDVAGTPMCRLCFGGGPGSEIRFEKVPRPTQRRRGGGRPPVGWPGGVRVVAATAALAPGTALCFDVPPAVPVDRARWGIYRAARLRGVRVSILRRGTQLTVWRKGSKGGQGSVAQVFRPAVSD